MIADERTSTAVRALIEHTYAAMSTPGSDVAGLFGAADIAVAGSGQGELWSGPDEAAGAAAAVSSLGFLWSVGDVTIWRRDDVAWAQILGSVRVVGAGVDEVVPYWTTGVFGLDGDEWQWLYWGGSEPQEEPKV